VARSRAWPLGAWCPNNPRIPRNVAKAVARTPSVIIVTNERPVAGRRPLFVAAELAAAGVARGCGSLSCLSGIVTRSRRDQYRGDAGLVEGRARRRGRKP
jgi:hypothetical protein